MATRQAGRHGPRVEAAVCDLAAPADGWGEAFGSRHTDRQGGVQRRNFISGNN